MFKFKKFAVYKKYKALRSLYCVKTITYIKKTKESVYTIFVVSVSIKKMNLFVHYIPGGRDVVSSKKLRNCKLQKSTGKAHDDVTGVHGNFNYL